ncbi:transcription factor IBH1-like 1 [Phoenix dactylifera]|uniref:Transcription factor IBH1-like 1 n=1 Tax=Phoenix dactylifera TaxID=42345 RepID=A0A8B8J1D0_PHODC|nr:transcription factor IBH1-like 1 [Phoenix dactylifera]XP_026657720.2 transcription factor IBH1-like 1 [Phoenix dactylifera]XP_026657721.2 transcription factor IBH1-like 1 [Phoenix dactylifera]
MHASNSFTQIFLEHMLLGLQHGGVASKSMSFLQRKRAIKLTADVAMAFAKDGAKWSHALIMNLSKKSKNKTLLRSILGSEYERLTKPRLSWKMLRAKKILQRSFKVDSRINNKGARRLRGVDAASAHDGAVVTRTKVLKRLVPGGEHLDDSTLLQETLDYVVSLRAQVDLMHLLIKALNVPNLKNHAL